MLDEHRLPQQSQNTQEDNAGELLDFAIDEQLALRLQLPGEWPIGKHESSGTTHGFGEHAGHDIYSTERTIITCILPMIE